MIIVDHIEYILLDIENKVKDSTMTKLSTKKIQEHRIINKRIIHLELYNYI